MRKERIGIVVIGKDEGRRLEKALGSIAPFREQAVYVDAGSADGSAAWARAAGFAVVELSKGRRRTAGAARNGGIDYLRRQNPPLEFVQLLDGDCSLEQGWLEAAASHLSERPHTGAVFGTIRESPSNFF